MTSGISSCAGLPEWGPTPPGPAHSDRPHNIPSVLLRALDLLEHDNPTDTASVTTVHSLGHLPTATCTWLAAVVTELALLRHLTGVAPARTADMNLAAHAIPDDTGASTMVYGMYGVRTAYFIDSSRIGPAATTNMVDELAYYQEELFSQQTALLRANGAPLPAPLFGPRSRAPNRNQRS